MTFGKLSDRCIFGIIAIVRRISWTISHSWVSFLQIFQKDITRDLTLPVKAHFSWRASHINAERHFHWIFILSLMAQIRNRFYMQVTITALEYWKNCRTSLVENPSTCRIFATHWLELTLMQTITATFPCTLVHINLLHKNSIFEA